MSENATESRPKVSRVRIGVLGLVALLIIAIIAWNARLFFSLNYAEFMLNQDDFAGAMDLLDKLENRHPQEAKVLSLQAKAYTLSGDYEAALAAAEHAIDNNRNPDEVLYWKAVSEYQVGQTTDSRASAQRFVATGEELPNGAGAIAAALAGQQVLLTPPALNSTPFRMMFPVEQATYLSLVAMEQSELGHYDLAARMFDRAFLLGNRNPVSLRRAALVSVLVGDVQSSKMYADFAGPDAMEEISAELVRRYGRSGQTKLTLQGEDMSAGQRRVDFARALTWVAAQTGETAGDVQVTSLTQHLMESYQNEPVIKLNRADMFARAGETSGARTLYQDLQKSDPTLAVLLRLAALDNTPISDIAMDLRDLIAKVDPVLTLVAGSFAGIETIEPGRKIVSNARLIRPINIPTPGAYRLSIVARATSAPETLWPLLYIKTDGEPRGFVYVSSTDWDVYSMTLSLDEGQHRLEFTLNPDEEDADDGEEVQWYVAVLTGSGEPV